MGSLQQLPWSAGGDVGFNAGVVHGDVHGDYESQGYHLVNLDSGNININPNMYGGSSFTGGPMVTGDGNGFSLQQLPWSCGASISCNIGVAHGEAHVEYKSPDSKLVMML